MKIHVACAIIEENGRVLAAQRNEFGRMPLKWEFPGGKIHVNESPEECLKREVMEEMGAFWKSAARSRLRAMIMLTFP